MDLQKLKVNINAKIITDNTDKTTENILISLYKLSPPCENYRNNNLPQLILNIEGKKAKVIGNGTVDIRAYVDPAIAEELKIKVDVNYAVLQHILSTTNNEKELKKAIEERIEELVPKHIVTEDMLASVNYLLNLEYNTFISDPAKAKLGFIDDIDHLGNRRIRCVGELLQNQFRIGLTRLERVVRERMTLQDLDVVTPQSLINTKPITSSIHNYHNSWIKLTHYQN